MTARLAILTRRKTVIAGTLSLVLLGTGLVACSAPAAPPNAELQAARARLTQVAGLPTSTGEAGLPTPASDGGTPIVPGPDGPSPGQPETFATIQRATEQAGGVPDVKALVDRQVPLATFTPNPSAPKPAGNVLYVRGGKFHVVPAAGGDSKELALQNPDMPSIWAPADDPGRAWSAPDGRHVAFFAGSDAEMWAMNADGSANVRLSAPNLPTGIESVKVAGGAAQDVRFRPKVQYTLVYGAGADSGEPFAVLVDNNERHIKGEGRMRFVHAYQKAKDQRLTVSVNGAPGGSPMDFGRSTGDFRVLAGSVEVEVKDAAGKTIQKLAPMTLGERELKTVFLTGSDTPTAVQETYEVMPAPPSDAANVRVFNAGGTPLDATVGTLALAKGLAPNSLGAYVKLPAQVSVDRRKDLEMGIYGLRPLEFPVAWAPDSSEVAWVGAPAGISQVFVSSPSGPARQVTSGTADRLNPTWSPDGKGLAWVEVDESSDQSIAFTVDGKLGRMDAAPIKAAMGQLPSARVSFPEDVTWVDDQTFIVYPVADRVSGGIWIYDTATGSLEAAEKTPVSNPDWSPAARAWVYGHQTEAGSAELYVMPLGGEPTKLPVSGSYPKWLPDGKRISWIEGDPKVGDGWAIHVINADGTGDKALTEKAPVVQSDPPMPGPNPKRFWLDGGKTLAFTLAGTDYGAREEAGFGRSEAGNDIENLWLVPADGSAKPVRATDLMKIYYLKELAVSPDGGALGFVAFAYDNRTQQLYAVAADGGKPVQLDSGVRWFLWQPAAGATSSTTAP